MDYVLSKERLQSMYLWVSNLAAQAMIQISNGEDIEHATKNFLTATAFRDDIQRMLERDEYEAVQGAESADATGGCRHGVAGEEAGNQPPEPVSEA